MRNIFQIFSFYTLFVVVVVVAYLSFSLPQCSCSELIQQRCITKVPSFCLILFQKSNRFHLKDSGVHFASDALTMMAWNENDFFVIHSADYFCESSTPSLSLSTPLFQYISRCVYLSIFRCIVLHPAHRYEYILFAFNFCSNCSQKRICTALKFVNKSSFGIHFVFNFQASDFEAYFHIEFYCSKDHIHKIFHCWIEFVTYMK